MPELPEVETVARTLRELIVRRTFESVSVKAPKSSIFLSKAFKKRSFSDVLKGRSVLSVGRRGKNLLISLSGEVTLWVHLKMTGQFRCIETPVPRDKHDLVVFTFQGRSERNRMIELRFNDYRRFGRLRLFPDAELWQQPGLRGLGPEPLEMSAEEFVTICYRRPRMIKPALLDQSFIAGIGNIYADEALYAARIHPSRPTTSISKAKLRELHSHIQRLLRFAISKMGTSVDSFAGVNGEAGQFQKYLKVYAREGEPCSRCGTKIVRKKMGARSAHFCPRCQRK